MTVLARYSTVIGRCISETPSTVTAYPVNCVVHYGQHYDNAFYDNHNMSFGDDDGRLFAVGEFLRSPDVIGHQSTHGVSKVMANLAYTNQAGGLNEAFSDIMDILVKQWKSETPADKADWIISSDMLADGIPGAALRLMKAPGTAYDEPILGTDPQYANAASYHTGDGPHISSKVINHAFYVFATALGGKYGSVPV